MLEEIGVAMVSGLIIGAIMTLMLYITAPKMTPRFMKGADVEGKISNLSQSLDAKVKEAVTLLDVRVERIFSNDVPKLLDETKVWIGNAIGDTYTAAVRQADKVLDEKVPQMIDGAVKSLMTPENMTLIKSTISDAVGDGLKPIAQGFKMALVGQKGNEARATKKASDVATTQQREFIKQTIITKYPQAAMPLQIAEQAGVLDGLLDQAIANPDMAQGIIEKFIGGGGGGGGTVGGPGWTAVK